MSHPRCYVELCTHLRDAATLGSVGSLLGWDQETYMPPAAAPFRAEQAAAIATLVHERQTSPRLGELIAECEADESLMAEGSETAANIREIRRDYDLATKLPGDLVAELARTGSQAQEAWKSARESNDFPAFAPWLEKMIALTRRKADCYGTPEGGERYDALLNEYEPGARAADIAEVFRPLRERLREFVRDVRENGEEPSDAPLKAKIKTGKQHKIGLAVLEAIGFDLKAGRLDVTTHPFCSGFAPGDTRLTTRYREQHFTDALYSTMHEAGHGLYEQGLPKTLPDESGVGLFGTPLAESISLGIHESQSRMWENFVGRSKSFWKWALPRIAEHTDALADCKAKDMFRAVNRVEPSLIRVEADEGTYNLHVMVRFEIERALLRGDLEVKDVPGVWNEMYREDLGVDVPDDKRGCLQDVHWSFGLVGYFPTYTLGNLYAAQFWEQIVQDIPDLEAGFAEGQFKPLLDWLREKIHRHGRRYRAAELCERITGKPLSPDPLMRHLERRVRPAYGLEPVGV